jgi:SAM-dependent methyltransferase
MRAADARRSDARGGPMAFRKFLLIPQLMFYGLRAPRDQRRAWERFWSGVHRTGAGGDVLWDTESPREADEALTHLRAHADRGLPLVDIGCGTGRFTRALAAQFPRTLGVDLSAAAIARARAETGADGPIQFQVLDIGAPGAGQEVQRAWGEVNLHMRGVLHVLDPRHRRAAAENLAVMLGRRGVLYLSETNIEGDPLDHLLLNGATATHMPARLRRCIAAGIRPPSRFGARELGRHFPEDRWEVIASGATRLDTMPLPGDAIESLPGYFAVMRVRAGSS